MLGSEYFYWVGKLTHISVNDTSTDNDATDEIKDALAGQVACDLVDGIMVECYKHGEIIGEYTDLSFCDLDHLVSAIDSVLQLLNPYNPYNLPDERYVIITNPTGVTLLQSGARSTTLTQQPASGNLLSLVNVGTLKGMPVLCSATVNAPDFVLINLNRGEIGTLSTITINDSYISTNVSGDFSDVKIIKMNVSNEY